jgi:hypothetical protein
MNQDNELFITLNNSSQACLSRVRGGRRPRTVLSKIFIRLLTCNVALINRAVTVSWSPLAAFGGTA